MYKQGDVLILSKGTQPWNQYTQKNDPHFMTVFRQTNDSLAIGPGKFHDVKLEFEIPDHVTRVQVRLTSFSMGKKLSSGPNPHYYRDKNGLPETQYLWSCEPVDNELAPEIATDESGRKCRVYIDRFVMKKTPEGKLVLIERLVPIE